MGHGCGLAVLLAFPACDAAPTGDVASEGGAALWSVDPEPVLVIGEVDGAPEYELFFVRSAFRLSDGATVVANAGTSELRYYDPEGKWVGSKGRKGQGPGEFEFLYTASALSGDTVFAWDHLHRRVTLFPPGEADPVTFTISLEGERVSFADRTAPAAAQRFAATRMGDLWVVPGAPAYLLSGLRATEDGGAAVRPELVAAPGVYHFHHPIFLIDRLGEVARRTDPIPGDPLAKAEVMNLWPLGGYLQADAGDSTFVAGRGAEPEVWLAHRDGSLRRVELGLPPARAVTDEIWDALTALRPESHADFLAEIPRPDSIPHYSSLVVDDRDRLWLGEFDVLTDPGPERHWWVFDLEGAHLATLLLPSDLEVMDIRDGYLTGLVRDDFDVERVVVYRVREGAG